MCGDGDVSVEVDEELSVKNPEGLRMGRLSTTESPLAGDYWLDKKKEWADKCGKGD